MERKRWLISSKTKHPALINWAGGGRDQPRKKRLDFFGSFREMTTTLESRSHKTEGRPSSPPICQALDLTRGRDTAA